MNSLYIHHTYALMIICIINIFLSLTFIFTLFMVFLYENVFLIFSNKEFFYIFPEYISFAFYIYILYMICSISLTLKYFSRWVTNCPRTTFYVDHIFLLCKILLLSYIEFHICLGLFLGFLFCSICLIKHFCVTDNIFLITISLYNNFAIGHNNFLDIFLFRNFPDCQVL